MKALAPSRGLAVLLLWACSSSAPSSPPAVPPGGLTTNTDSRSLADRAQRLEFLARYLKIKSPLTDAEYVIRYQDNSAGAIPGPSDWDIRAVLQPAGDVAAWHAGWEPCPPSTPDVPAWGRELLARRPGWQPHDPPRCLRDPRHRTSIAYVYDAEHLIVYRNASERQ